MFCNLGRCLKAYLFRVRESLRTMMTKYGKMCIFFKNIPDTLLSLALSVSHKMPGSTH